MFIQLPYYHYENMNPAGTYLLKFNDRNIKAKFETCSKLTKTTSKWRQWCHSSVFIVNFEFISHIVLVFLLLTLGKKVPVGNKFPYLSRTYQKPCIYSSWNQNKIWRKGRSFLLLSFFSRKHYQRASIAKRMFYAKYSWVSSEVSLLIFQKIYPFISPDCNLEISASASRHHGIGIDRYSNIKIVFYTV